MTTWTVEMTHPEGCHPCDEAASKAIDLAKCTGSVGATYNDNGHHTAAVAREPVRLCVGCYEPMPGEHARGCPTGQNGPPNYS